MVVTFCTALRCGSHVSKNYLRDGGITTVRLAVINIFACKHPNGSLVDEAAPGSASALILLAQGAEHLAELSAHGQVEGITVRAGLQKPSAIGVGEGSPLRHDPEGTGHRRRH